MTQRVKKKRGNTAAKGRRNEHKSRAILEDAGFEVSRSAASRGSWDLIAWNRLGSIYVQVKTNGWPGETELESLRLAVVPDNAVKLVHRWDDDARRPRVMVL